MLTPYEKATYFSAAYRAGHKARTRRPSSIAVAIMTEVVKLDRTVIRQEPIELRIMDEILQVYADGWKDGLRWDEEEENRQRHVCACDLDNTGSGGNRPDSSDLPTTRVL